MKIFEYMKRYGHEQLLVCNDPDAGLKAFIAIHDSTLGPACGGVRVWPHPTEEAALMDVLRLSRGMTYKSAAAGLSLGGGKGLIIADPRKDKTEALFKAFGRYVESLGGKYITAEDVGVAPSDLEIIATETRHIIGLPGSMGGSGDTSPLTGFGVYMGMKACAREVWGSDSLEGRTVAMQGFGNVGTQTAGHLIGEGARLIVTDTNKDALERARILGATIIEPNFIYDVECDIFAPSALGGILNDHTISRIKASIIAGGANNQLLDEKHGYDLQRRGILYAPDYIINAGGIIQGACEIDGPYNDRRARTTTARIYETMQRVISISKEDDIPTSEAADRLAEQRIAEARKARKTPVGV